MSHESKIRDTETHFIINPETRIITTALAGNNTLVQNDHNSERFTFEIPRIIDGHDMLESTEVRIHYRNLSTGSLFQQNGVYFPDDMAVMEDDNDTVAFSWLLSYDTTQQVGNLQFSIQFVCYENGAVEYAWNTGIYKDINVIESINNVPEVVAENTDELATFKKGIEEYVGAAMGGVFSALDDQREVSSMAVKRLSNIEESITPSPYVVDNTVAYAKAVPDNASPYAEVNEIGGMCAVENGVLVSAPLTEVKSVGKNLFDESIFFDTSNWVADTNFGAGNTAAWLELGVFPAGDYVFDADCKRTDLTSVYLYVQTEDIFGTSSASASIYQNSRPPFERRVLKLDNPTKCRFWTYFGSIGGDNNIAAFVSLFENIRITRGTTDTEFEPYKSVSLVVPEAVRSLPGYGEGDPNNTNECNRIDFENKVYHHVGDNKNGAWVLLNVPEVIDISDILPLDNYIEVFDGGVVYMENKDKIAVPNSVTFQLPIEIGGGGALPNGDEVSY